MWKTLLKSDHLKKILRGKNKVGFTLIEILVVVAILGVLGALSYPFYSRLIMQNTVSDAANNLAGSLRKAQSYAMASKDGSNWGVKYLGTNIILLRESTSTNFDTYNILPGIQIAGPDHIIFSKSTGLPSVTGTFTISGGNNTVSVSLNSEGVASVSK